MKHDMVAATAAQPVTGTGTGTLPGLRPRVALALVPLLSLGLLGAVPALVLAFRRGSRGDWLAAVGFTAVTVAWLCRTLLTPDETYGAQYALDVLLLSLSTLGAVLHCLFVRPSAGGSR